ncbi:MAG: site-2 protease family protein [Myxococcales bacterium]|nr:site-2 protease family protein [Myxococcales bacterium]
MSIVAAIVALCVVIILHELGHYLAAVWTGMKVDRFSVFGIGRPIVQLGTWRGTEFVISAIPFGAYVLIRGMEPDPDQDDARSSVGGDEIDDDAWAKARAAHRAAEASVNFRDKPLWARALVRAGGPVANYLTAMVLFFAVYMMAGVPGPATRIEITQVAEDMPAAAAGLEVGDRLVALGGAKVDPAADTEAVVEVIKAHKSEPLEVTLERDGQTLVKTVTPSDEGKIGAGLAAGSDPQPVGVGTAAGLAVERPWIITRVQLVGLYKWITRQIDAEMQGPARIVKHIATSIESGLVSFLKMAALISTLLGMFNLLPLPALDGGRLAFLGYEALSRRRASARVEELVHGYGMLALLVLIALVTVGDIRSFF